MGFQLQIVSCQTLYSNAASFYKLHRKYLKEKYFHVVFIQLKKCDMFQLNIGLAEKTFANKRVLFVCFHDFFTVLLYFGYLIRNLQPKIPNNFISLKRQLKENLYQAANLSKLTHEQKSCAYWVS